MIKYPHIVLCQNLTSFSPPKKNNQGAGQDSFQGTAGDPCFDARQAVFMAYPQDFVHPSWAN